ncbi:PAS domain-containing sensor histidine kinase [Thalassobius sp. S69A]|uniref:PAS domain-containing sensor histidine kinase n=1 Tax=unclassified Thalassovita TaxID=2619711 RepID=UPI000C11B52C|nr:PAS domain-containing sensor histidine kinase [Paracoccaceae bacterium]MBT27001.1 PAS domain-containing sensor histidine kinase [Paracoccaceae bacterium]
MQQKPEHILGQGGELNDAVWLDVLEAVDKTYADLVEYQEKLETRNNELQALRRFLGSILASISDYLVVVERDGQISNASASFCKAVGLERALLDGHGVAEFFDGAERDKLMSAMRDAIQRREEATVEALLTTPAGRDPVEFRIAPRLDRRRKGIGAVLTGRPLGELRRAYSELEESHHQLKETQSQLVRNEKLASLGRLLAGVAHELNNPISFVYANTHSLEKYASRFETYFERVQAGASRDELIALRAELKLDRAVTNLRDAVQGARDGAERVRDIVEDLRRLSAEGSGEMLSFDLVECARVAANWVRRGSKTALTLNFQGPAVVMAIGRPGHIQQVLMNLVQNAVDAMAGQDDPTITFQAGYEGDTAFLGLRDNGPGIPAEIAQTIFDPFFTTKDVGQGTGLGLSISHKIVEEHGGTLALCEQITDGACFRITLKRGDDG